MLFIIVRYTPAKRSFTVVKPTLRLNNVMHLWQKAYGWLNGNLLETEKYSSPLVFRNKQVVLQTWR
jgi:hypothetical protein